MAYIRLFLITCFIASAYSDCTPKKVDQDYKDDMIDGVEWFKFAEVGKEGKVDVNQCLSIAFKRKDGIKWTLNTKTKKDGIVTVAATEDKPDGGKFKIEGGSAAELGMMCIKEDKYLVTQGCSSNGDDVLVLYLSQRKPLYDVLDYNEVDALFTCLDDNGYKLDMFVSQKNSDC